MMLAERDEGEAWQPLTMPWTAPIRTPAPMPSLRRPGKDEIRRLLMLLDYDAEPDRVLPYPEVLTRLLAILAEELVRARTEPDARR